MPVSTRSKAPRNINSGRNGFRPNKNVDEVKPVTLDFDDDGELHLEIYPNRMTIKRQRELQEAGERGDVPAMADIFFYLVKSWDMEGEDGSVLPLNDESIEELSIATFFRIVTKLSETSHPKEETSNS